MRATSEVRRFRLKTLFVSGVLAVAMAVPASAATVTVFTETFDAALGGNWSGTTTVTGVPAGYTALGFNGGMLRNVTVGPIVSTVLTLNGLAAHDSVDINFLLAIIDSWDGVGGNPGPDTFVVRVDGVDRFSQVFAIQSGSDGPGAPPDLGAVQNRGFNPSFSDRGFDLGAVGSLQFAHTGSSLTIEFFTLAGGWQGGEDESWGLDNLTVDLITRQDAPIPEPATLSLLGLGLLGTAYRARKNRNTNA